jgi:hypothetical protein
MMRLVVGDEVGEVGYMCSLPLLQAMASRMVVSVMLSLETSCTEEEFNRDLARLDDPSFMMPSSIMWTAWGRRP